MPQLGKAETTKLFLPSTMVGEDGNPTPVENHVWVEMTAKLYVGDLTDIGHVLDTDERSILSLTKFIKAWNVTDGDGPDAPIAPIDEAHVRLLNIEDFDFIGEWLASQTTKAVEGLDNTEKKDSSVTSTEVTEPTPTPQQITVHTNA